MIFKDSITRKLQFSTDDEKMKEYLESVMNSLHRQEPVEWDGKQYRVVSVDVSYMNFVEVEINVIMWIDRK